MSRRPRGNKTSTAMREARQAQVAEKLADNKLQREIAGELGVSLATVSRDVSALLGKFLEAVDAEDLKALKRMQVEARQKTADAVLSGTVPPDVSNAWAKLQTGIERLLGLNAETRTRIDVSYANVQDMSSEKLVDLLMGELTKENYDKAIAYILELKASQAPVLEAEQAEEKSGLLGLPAPLHSYKADGEDE